MIPIRIHAMLDYAVGALLVLGPPLVGPDAAVAARWAPMLAGVFVLLYSAFTDYRWSLVRWMPFRTHLALDAFTGVFLLLSPWLFGFAAEMWWPHVALGLVVLAVTAATIRHAQA